MDQNTKDVLLICIPAVSAAFSLYIAYQMKRIEKNTNSMSDLMRASSRAEGKQEERDEQKARDVDLAALSQAKKKPKA